MKTIAGRVVRQLNAAVPKESRDRRWVETAKKILSQKRSDSGKIYSLQEPEVYCMAKGKEHKKYEFGAKATVVGKNGGVILGAFSLPENDYDGHALEPTLEQVERVAGYRPAVAIGDKGFRGQSHCGQTEVFTPERGKKSLLLPRGVSVGLAMMLNCHIYFLLVMEYEHFHVSGQSFWRNTLLKLNSCAVEGACCRHWSACGEAGTGREFG